MYTWPMHLLAGMLIALSIALFLVEFKFWEQAFLSMAAVVGISLVWEIYELSKGFNHPVGYEIDTLMDLLSGWAGCLVAAILLWLLER